MESIEDRRGGVTSMRVLMALVTAALLALVTLGLPVGAEALSDAEQRALMQQEHRPEDRPAMMAERMQRTQERMLEHDGECPEDAAAEHAQLREQRMAERAAMREQRMADGAVGPRGQHRASA